MQNAAHAADQLVLEHEADKRQWQAEQQLRDGELQKVAADMAQRWVLSRPVRGSPM